jgi:hypothetical protein
MTQPMPLVQFFTVSEQIGAFDTVLFGLMHAFFLSLPTSIPLLLCAQNVSEQGVKNALVSYVSVSFAQTVFIGLIVFGSSEILRVWYTFEPFLFAYGCVVSFRLVTQRQQGTHAGTLATLVLLNPVSLFQHTRFITSVDVHNVNHTLVYLFVLFVAMCVFAACFGIVSVSVAQYSLASINIPRFVPAMFVSSLLFGAISQYSWRVFVSYPLDISSSLIHNTQPHPSHMESGIRRRYVFSPYLARPQVIAIEDFADALQMMREENSSKSAETASIGTQSNTKASSREHVLLRFKSHFINRLASKLKQTQIWLRTPFLHGRTPGEIEYIQSQSNDTNKRKAKGTQTTSNRGYVFVLRDTV